MLAKTRDYGSRSGTGSCHPLGFDYVNTPIGQGVFTEWTDLTESHANSPYRDDVAAALGVLAKLGEGHA